MDVRRYLQYVRRGWRTLVALTLIVTALSAVFLLFAPKRYEATASLLLTPSSPSTINEAQLGALAATSSVGTYADVIDSAAVIQPALTELSRAPALADAMRMVTAIPRADSTVIDITAVGHDPSLVAGLANAVAREAIVVLPDLEGRSSSSAPIALRLIQPAEQPAVPVSPDARQVIVLAIGVGLVLGVATVIASQTLDTRIREIADLRAFALPALAVLPRASTKSSARRAPSAALRREADAYRFLRTTLAASRSARNSLLIAPLRPTGGDAVVSINLASSLAAIGHRVVLVDGDLRNPTIAEMLDLESGLGLDQLLQASAQTERRSAASTSHHGLQAIASRHPFEASADLLDNGGFRHVLSALEKRYDYVIVHGPPVLAQTDAAVIARDIAATALTVTGGRDRVQDVESAQELLHGIGVRPIGLILLGAHGALRQWPAPTPSLVP